MTLVFIATGSGPGETAAVSTFPFLPNRIANREEAVWTAGEVAAGAPGSGGWRAALPPPAWRGAGSSLPGQTVQVELLGGFLGPSSQSPD